MIRPGWVKPKSWKFTLRLPRSSFPLRPDPKLQQQWHRQCTDDLYDWQTKNRPEDAPFTLHDGPPYANGNLHVGHALNKILKDMILRVKVQQGRRVVYRPGWDCHGLPIEMKALGSSNTKGLTPVQIRDTARRLAFKTVNDQMKGFQSVAVMSDWEKRWTTMDRDFEIRQLRVFQNLVRQGLIYRKHKPVYWSTSSRTALAEAELEYRDDHLSTAAYIKFPIVSDWSSVPKLSKFDGPLYAAIWTTTPWTLPANKAIAVHNDLEYSVIRVGSDGLLVTNERVKAMKEMIPNFEVVIDSIRGSDLVGLQYHNKLRGQSAPSQSIIEAGFVTAESGTGLVHVAPGHGQDDYEACRKLGIDAFAPIDDGGCFTKEAYPDDPEKLTSAPSILDGGSQSVLDLMGEDVLGTHKLRHKYPYDWRTKRPVVIRATAQWFADVGSIKDDALAALRHVRFVPEAGRVRLESFVKGRSEWCISRQRSWGVPIPALYDEAGNSVMTPESIEHIISVMQERTSSAWFSDSPDEPAWIAPSLTGKYRRGTDTMDVWFDSGSSWTETAGPADVYLEGSDQHRGWFQSSLLTYVATQKLNEKNSDKIVAPFKTLITHGFTLDEQGKKMSKSLGNMYVPQQVMDGSLMGPLKPLKGQARKFDPLGPDIIRLWAASADFTSDVLIGESILRTASNSLLKYRTILKMLLGSLNQEARTSSLTKLDQIALVQLQDTMSQVMKFYDSYEFHRAVGVINRWVATDLSAFYLEALKDRLYCGDGGGIIEPIFIGFLRMLAPITPLMVEEVWSHRPTWMAEDTSLENPARQQYDSPLVDASRLTLPQASVRRDTVILLEVHNAVKATLEHARADKVLGSSLQCSVNLVVEEKNRRLTDILERYQDELEAIFVVSSVKLNQPVPASQTWAYEQEFRIRDAKFKVNVLPPKQNKCSRCWRYVAPSEDNLCHRCEEVVSSAGAQKWYRIAKEQKMLDG
ncbi:tRNA synthetases class I-domain-containing protein [Thelonectria olida]|uniref:Isoleucine--tRNA ligase, mitochondrial n=1 Tax=Thelonectria olida TaxID=1576542 RepID=A0A9P8WL02_9HYPO|nr:tRNA synthetases class I-domain-containing protein [Thelonectria olida]